MTARRSSSSAPTATAGRPHRDSGGRRRAAALATSLVLGLSGCADDDSAGPVTLDVPDRWERVESGERAAELVAERRWRPRRDDGTTLQVIVGCGDADADQLRQAMSATYHLTRDADAAAVEVVGLRSAQRIEWELRADPRGDAGAFRMAGLYGSGSGGLVVVELGGPAASFDPDLAANVLDSVEVAPDELAAACSTDGD